MLLRVFSATATGPTALAAFDRALQAGGVQDLNLVVLSSVIPAGAEVKREAPDRKEFRVGDRLYCVMAEERTSEVGTEVWAGLAWASDVNGAGGVFVEAHGRSQHQVEWELEQAIGALMGDRPYMDFGPPEFEVVGAACDGAPACALAMAVYESRGWRGGDAHDSVGRVGSGG